MPGEGKEIKGPLVSFIAVMILAILMIGSCIYAGSRLSGSSSELTAILEKLENDILSSDWESAEKNSRDFEEKWSGTKGFWAALTDHSEIDNIEHTFSRLKKFVQTKDTSLALAEVSVLNKFISHIPDNQRITLENIF